MTTNIFSATTLDATAAEGASNSRIGGFIMRFRKRAAERRMRDDLAMLDDAMLRDIGIAEDEIYRVRNLEHFTPRSWQSRFGA